MVAWMGWLALTVGAAAADEVGICGYRAVLFSAQNYVDPEIDDLTTPNRDIELVASVLRERFGFQTETMPDATRIQILDRLERLRSELSDCDAVVLYYAGHGELDDALQSGFWLPSDARFASKATWISNNDVATRVGALPSRHVLLVADSCFAGSLFRGLDRNDRIGPDQLRAKRLAARRSRTILTSGGEEPVADEYGQSGASVFAYFLHQQLSEADTRYVTPGDWFASVRDRVMDNAHQQPQMGRLFGAGHEGGSLVMVNQKAAAPPARTDAGPSPAAAPLPPPAFAEPPEGSFTTNEGVELVPVPAGQFPRGSGQGAPADERPQRTLRIGALEVMRSEVTQELWTKVMGSNPSANQACGPTCPVERVSWRDAITFANRLSEREDRTPAYRVKKGVVSWRPKANGYRLLTEAEWEYVASAGTPAPFAGGELAEPVGWIDTNSGGQTHPACTRRANARGLCDLTGNVREWVWDWYAADTYSGAPDADPTGPEAGTVRAVRGGSAVQGAESARVRARGSANPQVGQPDLGLRLARRAD